MLPVANGERVASSEGAHFVRISWDARAVRAPDPLDETRVEPNAHPLFVAGLKGLDGPLAILVLRTRS